jgi:uncharacterized protein
VDKFARFVLLYDFYGPLLTDKQRDCLDLYYEQDLSLGEIAEESLISRQAVHDLLKRTENILLEYETKLKLVERYLKQQEKLSMMDELLNRLEPPESPEVREIKQLLAELLAGD